MKKVLTILKNRYILTALIFLLWILVFDNNNLIERYRMIRDIKQMEQDTSYYLQEIRNNAERLKELQTDKENLEKFAREQYLMKKDNEDVFVIVE